MPPEGRVVAVVPALDEAGAIDGVVAGLRAQPLVDAVVVVDNGSSDGTGAVARAAGARVVAEPRRGYGAACRAGVLAADDADVVVLLDGDGADDPRDLPRVVGPVLGDAADLVVGVRTRAGRERGAMTPQQVAGNRVAAALMAAVHGVRVTDLGPFRAMRREALLSLGMTETGHAWSVEMVVRAARAGLRYREVPVAYRRRAAGVSKVGGTLRGSAAAGWAIGGAILRHSRPRPEAAR